MIKIDHCSQNYRIFLLKYLERLNQAVKNANEKQNETIYISLFTFLDYKSNCAAEYIYEYSILDHCLKKSHIFISKYLQDSHCFSILKYDIILWILASIFLRAQANQCNFLGFHLMFFN